MEGLQRRRRKRKPSFTPRFGPASVAFELGLIRAALAEESRLRKEEAQKRWMDK